MMVRAEGAWKETSSAAVRVAGAYLPVQRIIAYDGSQWRTVANFASALTATASPTLVSGVRTDAGPVTTSAASVTPVGGRAPFTYSWAGVGSFLGTINSPNSASTTFTRTLGSNSQSITETFQCTVTDSFGTTATADVTATFTALPSEGFE